MTAPTTIRVEEGEDRTVLILDRPEVRNAIDAQMIAELHEVCDRLEKAPRPLIVTGSGDTFAGGADIAELRHRGSAEALQGINSRLFERVARLPQPTIAAVNGPALGGGAELTYACDLRLASPTARWANPEPGLGILAAAGATWRLPALLGASVAKQVLLGGAALDAERALQLGLVQEIVEADHLMERAHQIVDQMLRSAPLALRLTKLVLDGPGGHPVTSDLAQAILFDSQEKQERMTRFLDRSAR